MGGGSTVQRDWTPSLRFWSALAQPFHAAGALLISSLFVRESKMQLDDREVWRQRMLEEQLQAQVSAGAAREVHLGLAALYEERLRSLHSGTD